MDVLRRKLLLAERPVGEPTPYEKPDSLIKREIYRTVRVFRAERNLRIIEQIVSNLNKEPTGVDMKENPFHWAFIAMKYDGLIELDYRKLWKFARQLLYADRHDIDHDLLIGFIYQSGPRVVVENNDTNRIRESWFGDFRQRSLTPRHDKW